MLIGSHKGSIPWERNLHSNQRMAAREEDLINLIRPEGSQVGAPRARKTRKNLAKIVVGIKTGGSASRIVSSGLTV